VVAAADPVEASSLSLDRLFEEILRREPLVGELDDVGHLFRLAPARSQDASERLDQSYSHAVAATQVGC
jgi:hypothetical protein